jgi:hypothetical protein
VIYKKVRKMKKVDVNPFPQSNLEILEKSIPKAQERWLSYFKALEDPRGKQGREYDFLSIVTISLLAVIGEVIVLQREIVGEFINVTIKSTKFIREPVTPNTENRCNFGRRFKYDNYTNTTTEQPQIL